MAATAEADKYEVLGNIGHGSFGVIHKVKRKSDNKILCRKEINYVRMSTKEREQLHAEFSILGSLRHPNIVQYFHRDHLKTSQELHIYMEYCGGGDLSKVIKSLKDKNQLAEEEYVWSIFAQLIAALYRCHYGVDPPEVGHNVMGPVNAAKTAPLRTKNQIMILHRDLKPENVFLGEDNSVKLGDFGLSKLMQSHDFASTYVGTPYYMSPEICAAEKYTLHSDIWSLGCVMYELCAKTPPFNAKTHFHLVQKIKEGRFDPLPSMYSKELQGVISHCLRTNPNNRPDTAALLNLPVIRLMRKEREVVEIGRAMKVKEEQALLMARELEARVSKLNADADKVRAEIDSTVRREWEVKARLEIDRQVAIEVDRRLAVEREQLKREFTAELHSRLHTAVGRELRSQESSRRTSGAHSPSDVPPALSSISTLGDSDTSTTSAVDDLSGLSLDSPLSLHSARAAVPRKTGRRTPFARSRTQFDSPMDVQMVDPSPMSIASLALSPRRVAALALQPRQNIFAAAERRTHWQAQLPSPPHLDGEADAIGAVSKAEGLEEDDNEEDDIPDLASPTRPPRAMPGMLLHPPARAGPSRPGLQRQSTLPTHRPAHTALFAPTKPLTGSPAARIPKPVSPNRRVPVKALGGKATLSFAGDDMVKTAVRNTLLAGAAGRTLVELQQARTGGAEGAVRVTVRIGEKEAAVSMPAAEWDPEHDEMPSPFLVRRRSVFPTGLLR